MPLPPARTEPRRRNHSRQREEILAHLRSDPSHPTAAELHGALQRELPKLSLGTVYRNLEILVADGSVRTVRGAPGGTRYDGNVAPHDHFICERCRSIIDIPRQHRSRIARRLERARGVAVTRVAVDFFGICSACRNDPVGSEPRASASPTRSHQEE